MFKLAPQEDTVLTQINFKDTADNVEVTSYFAWADSISNKDSIGFCNFNEISNSP